MINHNRLWGILIFSLTVGSFIAISERLIGKFINLFLPEVITLEKFERYGSITILSSDNIVIQKIGPTNHLKLKSNEIPLIVKEAFIAAEDRRFYRHNGIDLWSISRALFSNLRERSVQEGGSTITQQLARIVYLNQDRNLSRKFIEAGLAYKIEKQLSKNEILENYLNNVYLGSGAYGVADASWVYFSKKPQDLEVHEIALLAGLPPAPSYFSPLVNPRKALKRRSIVLNKMLTQNIISNEKFKEAYFKPLELKPSSPKFLNSSAPFFSSWVKENLSLYISNAQIRNGGLRIKTSLNMKWQNHARDIINEQKPNDIQGALVAIEPSTGLVRVLIGGKDFTNNQFNRATQALRSPGSTFKIFPYAAALKSGFRIDSQVLDKRKCWDKYCPKNFGNKYLGKTTLLKSFTSSSNIVAVELLEKVGFNEVIDIANQLGVGDNDKLGRFYPLAIGSFEQTVVDMTGAYAGLANRGLYLKPIPIEEIRGPKNRLLWSINKIEKRGVQAIPQEVADKLNFMLTKVVEEGTGRVAKLADRPVAGKTGTSEGGRDLWFIGSIPQLSAGVWIGFDDNRKTRKGSGEAAWVWKRFMSRVTEDLDVIYFTNESSKNFLKDTI